MLSKIFIASLGYTTATSATNTTFELFFGLNWPYCKELAPTIKELYHADGIAAAVDFKLSPDIKGPNAPRNPTGKYLCVDETNCDPEMYFLCGQSVGGSVDFFACLDASNATTPEAKTKECASVNNLDFDKIQTCFSGDQGKTLVKAAADHIDEKYPHGLLYGVPHMEINGQNVDNTDRSYTKLLKDICDVGIKAGACSKSDAIVIV